MSKRTVRASARSMPDHPDAAILALSAQVLALDAQADEITVVFCGSKKSLASGVPMASVLFPAALVGVVILPLMLFHQLQLIVCAIIARHYAEDGRET